MARVRDRRQANWFWMNKDILDIYGPKIGANGIAIYAFLARCANEQGHAIPSIRFIAKHVDLSLNTVRKYLEVLEKVGLIATKLRYDRAGDFSSTEYVLLTPSDAELDGGGSTIEPPSSTIEPPARGGVVQPLKYGGATIEPFQEPLNKKTKDPDLTPLTPQGGKRTTSKEHSKLTRIPDTEDGQEALKASIFDSSFAAWHDKRFPHADAEAQWEYFVNQCLAKDYRYASFRQAFMNSFAWENSPAYRTTHATSRASPQETFERRQREMEEWAKEQEAHDAIR